MKRDNQPDSFATELMKVATVLALYEQHWHGAAIVAGLFVADRVYRLLLEWIKRPRS
ncbi:hypothetical protein [Massilia phyllosphaerae]|uniref:hypothetical protein n=1 Tax=Massilia phyllosphaerae TaxID=3106034 RepID=UPI002B1CC3F8|nr:hypothetical protein [Massilia sp. SGZ-792]